MEINPKYTVGSVVMFNAGMQQSIIQKVLVEIFNEGIIYSYELKRMKGEDQKFFGHVTERSLQDLLNETKGFVIGGQ